MKKVMYFLILFFLGLVVVQAEEVSELSPNSKSAILMDANTGTIFYQKNANEPLPPASMTKIMSMLLIMEAIENGHISLDTDVVISERASSMGGSQIFLETGEVYKVSELLKGIAIASGNDAVVAMAEKVSGSVEEFVKRMNGRAKELGLVTTTFVNPHGLDSEGHLSSANDMAIIAKELLKHEKILEYTSIYEDYLKKNDGTSTWLVNTNKLVRFYDGVDGLKTGFTSEAGYCLTATAKRNNLRLIAVVMGVETSDLRSSDISSMLNYGFNAYRNEVMMQKGTVLGTKRVENGNIETVEISLKEDYIKLLNQTEKKPNYSYEVKTNKLIAPIHAGDVIGKLEVIDESGSAVDELEITITQTVEKASLLELWIRNLKNLTAGKILIK